MAQVTTDTASVPAPTPTADATVPPAAPQPAQQMTILDAVRQGRALLKADQASRAPKLAAAKPSKSAPNQAEIALAVWDKDANAVSLVYAVKSGTSLTVTTPGNWPIRVTREAKQSSTYGFTGGRNAQVVGVRYPVSIKGGTKKKPSYTMKDTVYVPSSDPAFYNPAVLSAGSDYLSYLIQDAFDELRAKGIKSRAYPDKLVADVIDPYLLKSIVVIEHSGHVTLLGDDEPESVLGQFLVKLALNEGDAFDNSISSAGASGLVQFIPSTYKLYVTKRPDLGLIPDFRTGMADHKNAVKAEVAHLDSSLAGMPQPIRDIYASDKTKAAEFLAAAYNGGDARVRKAFAAYGESWADNRAARLPGLNATAASLKSKISTLNKRIKAGKDVKANKAALSKATTDRANAIAQIAGIKNNALRGETAIYVAKLRKTYSLLSAGAFATPAAPSGGLPVGAQTASATVQTITPADSGTNPASAPAALGTNTP
ncbi:MAG: hypothetical protein RLZZ324_970 [Candidatus Parcubacteria bacterium]